MHNPEHRILSFNGFTLNLTRGCLLRETDEIKLRPKAFAVLKHLVNNSGRLLSKEELVEAVWPGTAVTDDSLVQCLIEVRRALGDGTQQTIKTVPRRGYLFDANVIEQSPEQSLVYTDEMETVSIAIEEESDDDSDLPFLVDAVTSQHGGTKLLTRASRYNLMLAIVSVLVITGVALGAYLLSNRSTAIDSVAVMPFVNAGSDPEIEYLADGLTESMINNLSQLSELKVVPRNSVYRYKGRDVDSRTIARELNVTAVLTGRLEQRGDSLTISLELVDVRENRQLWGERYTRPISDILKLQTEISQSISEKLRLRLKGEEKERLGRHHTDNAEAYQLYLRGRYHWDKWIVADVRKSIVYFEKAISIDPNFALAYTGLADAYSALNGLGAAPSKEVMPKAKAAVERALDLDPALSEAYTARGMIRHFYDWDFAGGDQDFLRAIKLKPNSATAHHLYAKNLPDTGRFDEALVEFKRALELDPYSVGINKDFGETLFYSRQYDQAIAQLRKTLDLEPNYIIAYYWLARTYEAQGLHDLAVDAYLKSRGSSERQLEANAARKDAYVKYGWKGFSQAELERAKKRAEASHFEPYYMVLLYLRNGDKEQALQWLEKAYDSRSSWIPTITFDPLLDSLRSDPRFQGLVGRAGLK